MTTFYEMIEAVEDNNRVNQGEWKDWQTVMDLEQTYGSLVSDYPYCANEFLAALIRDNGENVEVYKDAYRALNYGLPIYK